MFSWWRCHTLYRTKIESMTFFTLLFLVSVFFVANRVYSKNLSTTHVWMFVRANIYYYNSRSTIDIGARYVWFYRLDSLIYFLLEDFDFCSYSSFHFICFSYFFLKLLLFYFSLFFIERHLLNVTTDVSVFCFGLST